MGPTQAPGRGLDRLVSGEYDTIEHVMGERVSGCAWRAFDDPDVGDVLRAHDYWPSCSEWYGDDPEWWLVEGTQHFHRQLERARVDAIKVEEARATAKARGPQLPPGMEVLDTQRG